MSQRRPMFHRGPALKARYQAAVATRPGAPVAGTGGVIALVRSPLIRRMLEKVLAEPILLSPDERYSKAITWRTS